jgi:hypothetical protein
MTRILLGATIAFGLLLGAARLTVAGGALIETTAPLPDRSEDGVKAAVIVAISKAVRGATAMGFAWFQLRNAKVSTDQVAVQILATDERPDDAVDVDPGEKPDTREGGQNRGEEPSRMLQSPPASPRVRI